jgi:hypothetical protein
MALMALLSSATPVWLVIALLTPSAQGESQVCRVYRLQHHRPAFADQRARPR